MALDPALMAVTFTGVDGSAVDLKLILNINKELVIDSRIARNHCFNITHVCMATV